jgi:hypothetical protein
MNTFVYANTGPAKAITVTAPGTGFTSTPSISIVANTRIKELGILGHMQIVNGGLGYQINDTITFTNVLGGYGVGAAANVTNVAANGRITEVKFVEMPGHIIGGAGYSTSGVPKYPTANVVSANANAYGASIVVTALLGDGGSFLTSNSTIGAIEKIAIVSRGSNYSNGNTFIDLTGLGDGTAQASIKVIEGAYTYPGRYLNDDGFLSSYNFLQDRDYYQNFSYVIRSRTSIDRYRKALKNLVHPSGMKVFGDFLFDDVNDNMAISADADDSINMSKKTKTYAKTGNTINISYTSHGLSIGNTVSLDFKDGGTKNVKSGIYTITAASANNFEVKQPKAFANNIIISSAGLGYSNGILIFSSDSGYAANGTFEVDANGSIIRTTITDYGRYYNSVPTVIANGSNTSAATLKVVLDQYANNTSGNVNVSTIIV